MSLLSLFSNLISVKLLIPFKNNSNAQTLNYIREIHVLRSWEGLEWPVEEAVDEDQAGTASPHQKNGDEGNTEVVDHLIEQQLYHWFKLSLLNKSNLRLRFTFIPGKVTADEAYEPIMSAMKVERRSPNMLGS